MDEDEDKEKDDFASCQDLPVVFFGGLQLSLFSAPPHHQFGRLPLPTSKNSLLLCTASAPAGLEYLQSLKTVPSPLIFSNRCFSPLLFRRKLSMNVLDIFSCSF